MNLFIVIFWHPISMINPGLTADFLQHVIDKQVRQTIFGDIYKIYYLDYLE